MITTADAEIYAQILANMRDGVLTLDLAGRITTFNPAAGALLGAVPEEALGQPFAELFFADPAFEQLSELVLQAIYEPSVTHSREIGLALPDRSRTLLVHTTLLAGGDPAGGEARGVIIVLSDLTEQRKRRKLKRLFGAYVDPRIVERLVARADRLEGASREATTIAFLDMEGFTRIAERLSAADLVRLLNAYLEEMSIPVGNNQGVTDKYIGDAIMAFWSPVFVREGAEPAALACRAALAQRERLGPLRRRLREELDLPLGPATIETRCGIATGDVVAGSIGPEHARNYTVIGDAVNVAARLEAANKALGTRILVAAATYDRAGDDFVFRSRGAIELPGRSRPERVFELVGER